ncbi:MAG: TraR/DksA C4-type zinc finger protein, partial [Candidatus Omnitrophota bacterium]|nr:TraR/DksA C4-type zinc finger protein [Candidatus Omnitrophota bacterium]
MSNKKAPSRLSSKELEYYKKILLKLKDELAHDIKKMGENTNSGDSDSRDLSGHVQHMADVATDMYDKEFSLGLASKDREILQRINDALKRIEDGTYGFCLGTGTPITKVRLEAIPYAEYCLEYQEQIEKKNRA